MINLSNRLKGTSVTQHNQGRSQQCEIKSPVFLYTFRNPEATDKCPASERGSSTEIGPHIQS